MIKIARCQYCNKEFIAQEEDYDNDYIAECVMHECEHIRIGEQFQNNLKEAIEILNKKYNVSSNYTNYTLTLSGSDNEIDCLAHMFSLNIALNQYNNIIYSAYKNFKKCNTVDEIISQIEEYYEDETRRKNKIYE